MNKYLILYFSTVGPGRAGMTELAPSIRPAQMEETMAGWLAILGDRKSAILDLGGRGDARTILKAGGVLPDDIPTVGYSMLQAETIEDALALLQEHPFLRLPGCSAQIVECTASWEAAKPTPGTRRQTIH